MFVASLVYAESFSTKLPPWRAGQAGQDDMRSGQYSRFVYVGSTPVYLERTFNQAQGTSLNNMGYLYGANLVGAGNIFYCPALSPGNPYDGSRYSPLLTSDGGGMVRSSYYFNPRMVNWDIRNWPVNTQRRYLKTTQFEPHKVFGLDIISGLTAHRPEQGYNVVFTDGSVKFCSVATGAAASLARSGYVDSDYASREQLYDLFEGM
jgi:hypothetical protein